MVDSVELSVFSADSVDSSEVDGSVVALVVSVVSVAGVA